MFAQLAVPPCHGKRYPTTREKHHRGGEAQQMQQEALQNAARPRFAVRTTAVCRGRYRRRKIMALGIARGFRVESRRRRRRWATSLGGVAGRRRWAASLGGVTGRRRWAASLAGVAGRRRWRVAGKAAQKERNVQLSQLKRPTPPSTEKSAQRTASRGGTRVITARSLVEPPAIPHRARDTAR